MPSPSEQIVRLGFGFAVSQALRVVIELGIFEAAGLRLERVIETRGPISILEASPA